MIEAVSQALEDEGSALTAVQFLLLLAASIHRTGRLTLPHCLVYQTQQHGAYLLMVVQEVDRDTVLLPLV